MNARVPESSRSQRPPPATTILRVWRADHSIRESSARLYLRWIGHFRQYCEQSGLVEADELTCAGIARFKTWYADRRRIKVDSLASADSSMHALHRVYEVMAVPVPAWKPIASHQAAASMLLRDYAEYLARQRGSPEVTIRKKLSHISSLLDHLGVTGKACRRMRLPDIDAFLMQCAQDYSRAICSH